MNFLQLSQTRYTAKAYDKTRKIPQQQLTQLLEILRLTPSSINIQPWHFVVVQSDQAKQKITQATQGEFEHNIPKILNASEVVIFTAKMNIDEQHVEQVIACEDQVGRFPTAQFKQTQKEAFIDAVNLYKSQNILDPWVDQQIHIALGSLLYAAASLGIDATPMGGFDNKILDQVLGLTSQNLRSVVIACLGYHSDQDFNAHLSKARLPHDEVIQFM